MTRPSKKMKLKYIYKISLLLLLVFCNNLIAQPSKGPVVDQVAGVVGSNIVLLSEIETQYHQFLQQGNYAADDLKCRILDQLLLNKLLIHQAGIDSVTVDEDQVNQKINSNMAYYIQQFGSAEKLEQFYGKSIPELKEEFKPMVRDQMIAQQMQSTITKDITVSPAEVKAFYNSIPQDSLPLINAEVEYAQIIRNVKIGDAEKKAAKEQITEIRERIKKGEEFSTMAVLYSMDKESARNGGELGFVNRGDLVPAFEAVAFRLKNTSEISEPVESPFGFHIIQLVERRGEKINVRHILITPKTTADDIIQAQQLTDSIATEIREGRLKFETAAEKFSDDTDSKLNGGNVVNPSTGAIRFETDQVDPSVLFQLDKMQPGEITQPAMMTTKEGKQAYRIIMLKSRTEPHRLNMEDDYQKLQEIALTNKQQKTLENWRNKKKALTYIRIAPEYTGCEILRDWTIQ